MSRMSSLRTGLVRGFLGVLALQSSVLFAQSRELSPEAISELTRAYAEMRRRNPELEERSAQQIATDVQALLRARRERMRDTSAETAVSAEGSVAATARCKEGYVLEGKHKATDQSVSIVSANQRDCDAGGCRAYEVSAVSERTEPFDLEVSVTCSN